MKIKMLGFYTGVLSDGAKFEVGSEQTVNNEVGETLIERGKAMEVRKPKAKAGKPKAANVVNTKEL